LGCAALGRDPVEGIDGLFGVNVAVNDDRRALDSGR
jgi:hypothetical protein